jgi:hypothetical protein
VTSRRLTPEEATAVLASATPIPSAGHPARAVRTALAGADPTGRPVEVSIDAATLVVFLSTTCDGCRDLAELVRRGARDVGVLGVLRTPSSGLPDAAVDAFVGTGGAWLCGDDPFEALQVRSAPYFCVLDATGTVVVEGVALGAAHVEDHVARALAGHATPDAVRLSPEAT